MLRALFDTLTAYRACRRFAHVKPFDPSNALTERIKSNSLTAHGKPFDQNGEPCDESNALSERSESKGLRESFFHSNTDDGIVVTCGSSTSCDVRTTPYTSAKRMTSPSELRTITVVAERHIRL